MITDPQTVNQMQPGAFDETAMCSLCAKLTNEFQLAIGMSLYIFVLC